MADFSISLPQWDHYPSNELLTQLLTLEDWLRFCISTLSSIECDRLLYYGHGTDNASDEAAALVFGVLHLPLSARNQYLTARLMPAERLAIWQTLQARIQQQIPLAYLLGEWYFAGLLFKIDQRALIPRSPIAELIEQGFEFWFPERDPERILDLCCGSGCLGIASAVYLPTSTVVLADIDRQALTLAQENIVRFQLTARVETIQSDLFAQLTDQKRFQLIICNPPYVNQSELAQLPTEFRHEPELALAAGEDGLAIMRLVLQKASQFLTEDGVLLGEVGNSERQLIEAFPNLPLIWLEFTHGGHGVFAITAADLACYSFN